jgi:hypothetical protein
MSVTEIATNVVVHLLSTLRPDIEMAEAAANDKQRGKKMIRKMVGNLLRKERSKVNGFQDTIPLRWRSSPRGPSSS